MISSAQHRSDTVPNQFLSIEVMPVTAKTIWIKSIRNWLKLRADQILFVHSDSNYSTIVYMSANQTIEKVSTSRTLKHWQIQFETESLVRIHNRFVINKNRIVSIDRSQQSVLMEGDCTIPYARSKRTLIHQLAS